METCKLLSEEVDKAQRSSEESAQELSLKYPVSPKVSFPDKSIDRMEITKDSIAYTFSAALKSEINKYFNGIENNAKEEKNFAKRHRCICFQVIDNSDCLRLIITLFFRCNLRLIMRG